MILILKKIILIVIISLFFNCSNNDITSPNDEISTDTISLNDGTYTGVINYTDSNQQPATHSIQLVISTPNVTLTSDWLSGSYEGTINNNNEIIIESAENGFILNVYGELSNDINIAGTYYDNTIDQQATFSCSKI